MRRATLGAALAAIFGAGAMAQECELALVLAIDVSGSVDPIEYAIQMDGLGEALADPTVRDALIGTGALVTVVQWTGANRQKATTPWRRLDSDADVDALAAEIAASPRAWRHFSTAIGGALAFAADRLGGAPLRCERRVIDVSGDGRSNEGRAPEPMRDALVRAGVTVNGLAIEGSEPDLTGYYRDSVIGGAGAFVLTADGFEDYPRAIRRKLLREVTAPVVEGPALAPMGPRG